MKRLLASLLAVLAVVVPVSAHDWSDVAYRLSQATAMLTNWDGDPFCSGFSIDNKRDYMMTAAHCVASRWANEGFLVDNTIPVIVEVNSDLDVAVLYVEGMDRPELKPRTKMIKVGMEVASYGFAAEDGLFGHLRTGNISSITNGGPFENYSAEYLKIHVDQALIGGMSGGPLVDTDGKVVTVNQLSDRSKHGAGVEIGAIYRATQKYWRK